MKTGVEFGVRRRGAGALIAAQAAPRTDFDSLYVVGDTPLDQPD